MKKKNYCPPDSVENATEMYYSVDSGSLKAFDGSTTLTINGDEGSVQTVYVKAVNGTKSAEATYTYKIEVEDDDDDKEETVEIFFDVTGCSWFGNDNAVTVTLAAGKNLWSANSGLNGGTWSQNDALGSSNGGGEEKSETMTVYFVNNYGWNGTVKAYFWGSEAQSVSWPGVEMTSAGKDSNGNAMYKIVVPTDIVGLIFTNGSSQTVDITTNLKDGAVFSVSGNSGSKYSVSVK